MDSIVIALLLALSVSASILIILAIQYIDRTRHIARIKKMLNEEDEEFILKLNEEQEKKYKNSYEYKIKRIMSHAGIYRYQIPVFIGSYLLISLTVAILLTDFIGNAIGALVGMLIGTYLHYSFIKTLINRRLAEFNRALAIAISVLVKMMRNGVGFEQSIQKAVDVSSSNLFKKAFENFFQEKNTFGEEKAFENMLEIVDSKELRIFAISVKIGRQSGGRFSQTLEKLEQTIRYRKKMQDKIDVVTREGTVGSYIVAIIAVVLYFMLNLNFGGKLHSYYMESPYGRYQLLGIALWIFIGLIVNKMITRVKT